MPTEHLNSVFAQLRTAGLQLPGCFRQLGDYTGNLKRSAVFQHDVADLLRARYCGSRTISAML
jgi:hypothetical protein